MAYELKDGQGTIFKNNKTSDNQPDYRGVIKTPKGEELEIALWVRDGTKGKYFSAKVQEPRRAEESQSESNEPEDDLPF